MRISKLITRRTVVIGITDTYDGRNTLLFCNRYFQLFGVNYSIIVVFFKVVFLK